MSAPLSVATTSSARESSRSFCMAVSCRRRVFSRAALAALAVESWARARSRSKFDWARERPIASRSLVTALRLACSTSASR